MRSTLSSTRLSSIVLRRYTLFSSIGRRPRNGAAARVFNGQLRLFFSTTWELIGQRTRCLFLSSCPGNTLLWKEFADFYRHTINFRLGVSDCLASKISVSLPWGSEFNICVSRITASFCSVRYILSERVFPVRYRFESVFWSKFLLTALLLLYHICFPEENVQVPEEDSGGESGEECAGGGYVWQRNIKPAGYSWTLWVCWIDSVTFKVESNLLCLGWCVKKCLKIKST